MRIAGGNGDGDLRMASAEGNRPRDPMPCDLLFAGHLVGGFAEMREILCGRGRL